MHEPLTEAPPRKREREIDKPQREALPRERKYERARTGAKCKPEVEALPPVCECERGTTPQGNPNEGDREPSWPPQEPSHDDVLSTCEGPGPRDPGGKSSRERNFRLTRSVEATGIVAHKKNLGRAKRQSGNTTTRGQPRTLAHAFAVPSHRQKSPPVFSS